MKRKRYTHYYYVGDEELHDTPIKKLTSEVESYMIKYRKYKLRLEFNSFKTDDVNSQQLSQYVDYIDKIISYLRPDAKEFIISQFITCANNPLWWTDIYNRSSFFKIRKLALIEFLQYVR